MPETLIPITPKGLLLDQVLEDKIRNLLTSNPKPEKIRWRFSAIKSTGAAPKFSVTQGAFEDNDAKSETLSVYGYSHVLDKMAPSITTTNSPESKIFKPLQIIFENNHNAGQLIDLFSIGIGMKQINILEIVKEDKKSKVHRKKFEDCQPIGFQLYGSFMVMYYTYLKITDTKRVFNKHGDDTGTKEYIASITEPPKN